MTLLIKEGYIMDTKPITKEDKAFAQLVDKESAEIIESMMMPINTIYIDSDFLYDYRLGALLMFAKDENTYNYILSKIGEYECNPTMKITKVFPDLGLSEEDVDLMEFDVKYEPYVAAGAPRTEFLDDFQSFIAWVATYNKSQTDDNRILIIINFREHKPTEIQWKALRQFITMGSRYVSVVKTEYSDWDSIDDDLFDKIDMMFVYDMPNFANSLKLAHAVRRFTSHKKLLFAYPQVEIDRPTPEEDKEALDNFAAAMGIIFYKFSYIKRSISKGR